MPDRSPGRVWRLARTLGSVRLGMSIVGLIGVYAAAGMAPIGAVVPRAEAIGLDPRATLRHLPALDMTETEYFATPVFVGLCVALLATMACATATRLRRGWAGAPAMLVHAGVGFVALGGVIHAQARVEGDLFLPVGAIGAPGPRVSTYGVRGSAMLSVRDADGEVKRYPLTDLPRHVDVGAPWSDDAMDLALPESDLRIVGYAKAAAFERVFDRADEGPSLWRIGVGHEEFDLPEGEVVEPTVGLQVEHVARADDLRWDALSDAPALAGLRLLLEAESKRVWIGARRGAVARAGSLDVEVLAVSTEPEPVALVRFADARGAAFDRLIHARRPERDSDVLPLRDGERWLTGTTSQRVRTMLFDASAPHIALRGTAAVVRSPGRAPLTIAHVEPGGRLEVGPELTVRLIAHEPRTRADVRPVPLRDRELRPDLDEQRARSALAVADGRGGAPMWLAYAPFGDPGRPFESASGDVREASYGPRTDALPGFALSLIRLDVVAPPRGAVPRDIAADVVLHRADANPEPRRIALNAPLVVRERTRGGLLDRAAALVAPAEWTLSITAWDREGWSISRALAGIGVIESARPRFVVLRVARRRGTALLGAGGVLIVAAMPLSAFRRRLAGGEAS